MLLCFILFHPCIARECRIWIVCSCLPVCQGQITLVAGPGVCFSLLIEHVCLLREGELKGSIAVLAHDELLEVARGLLGVELERILSFVCQLRIEAIEVPVACLDCLLFLGDGEAHGALHVVLDARAVADDEGRSVIGLSLADGAQCLVGVGTQGNLCDVDVSIAHCHHAQVFLPGHFAACRKLGNCRCGCGLGSLAAGVGVNFGIEDQDVDVLPEARTWSSPP